MKQNGDSIIKIKPSKEYSEVFKRDDLFQQLCTKQKQTKNLKKCVGDSVHAETKKFYFSAFAKKLIFTTKLIKVMENCEWPKFECK